MKQQIPGGMDAETFLRTYWQKQPCLLRQSVADFQPFLHKAELFDLARIETVESRLVLENGGDYPWQVLHGPFSADDFTSLPQNHWSLLVQHAELYIPAAAAFLDQFNFIPNWRIDDLMISYAPPLGSVGPHLDSYDVFLFQAFGKRSWSINSEDYSDADFIDGLDLRIIDNYQARQTWVLEPGDMLYLPPGVAHHGVALEECMTYSIGFRAPSASELLGNYLDECVLGKHDARYADPELSLPRHCGEISSAELQKIHVLLHSTLPDEAQLRIWFGEHITRLPDDYEAAEISQHFTTEVFIREFRQFPKLRKIAIRAVFLQTEAGVSLFINGVSYLLPPECRNFAENFTASSAFDNPLFNAVSLHPGITDILCQLYNTGHLLVTDSGKQSN